MRLARAEDTDDDFHAILGLIEGAATWLRSKHTDQWAAPWPDAPQRDARVRKGLGGGKTWIVWDGRTAAATITIAKRANPDVWGRYVRDLSEPAVYAHRLISAREYAGLGLGACLIDWAGSRAARQYGARSVKIDVWKTNLALHAYYREQGFQFVGFCADPDYPSGALFQKPVTAIENPDTPPCWDPPADDWLA